MVGPWLLILVSRPSRRRVGGRAGHRLLQLAVDRRVERLVEQPRGRVEREQVWRVYGAPFIGSVNCVNSPPAIIVLPTWTIC